MRHQRSVAVIVAAVLCLASQLHAQSGLSTADVAPLQGTWVLDTERSGVTEAERRVITTGPTWMRMEIYRLGDDRQPTIIYNLDGSTTVNPFGRDTADANVRREDGTIVTETVFNVRDHPVTLRERLHPSADGTELRVEVTLRIEHGYQGVQPSLEPKAPNVSTGVKLFQKQP